MGKRAILQAAFANAAALIENMDFDQLFGEEYSDALDTDEGQTTMTEAQAKVVAYLRKRCSGPSREGGQ